MKGRCKDIEDVCIKDGGQEAKHLRQRNHEAVAILDILALPHPDMSKGAAADRLGLCSCRPAY